MTSPARPYGLLPSLMVLGAVFYFINSACFSSRGGYDAETTPCGFSAPKARIAILEPTNGAVFQTQGLGKEVEMTVRVAVTGIRLAARHSECRPGVGHVLLVAQPSGCSEWYWRRAELLAGESEGILRLVPGRWIIRAAVVDDRGERIGDGVRAMTEVNVRDGDSNAPEPRCIEE